MSEQLVGAVHIRHVSKTYDNTRAAPIQVLDDISLDIQPGEFISIVGSSGCGKSTLLRLLVGLETSFDGSIDVDGMPVHGTSLDRGIVFQDHRLFPWLNVRKNIRIALQNSADKSASACLGYARKQSSV